MIPWELLDTASLPGGGDLQLWRRDDEYSIRARDGELMNSRVHGSEDSLAELACARIADRPQPAVLIGGLGLGFTLAAALRGVGKEGRVVVAELVPAVVAWNREILGHVSGHPLNDTRVTVREADVADIIGAESEAYDAILLDVDNGPDALSRRLNGRLYNAAGLRSVGEALRSRGVLGVWSVDGNPAFTRRLWRAGFAAEEIRARIRQGRGGRRHTIWLAAKQG